MEKILYTILGPHACMFDNIIHEPFAFSDYLLYIYDFVIAMSNVIV